MGDTAQVVSCYDPVRWLKDSSQVRGGAKGGRGDASASASVPPAAAQSRRATRVRRVPGSSGASVVSASARRASSTGSGGRSAGGGGGDDGHSSRRQSVAPLPALPAPQVPDGPLMAAVNELCVSLERELGQVVQDSPPAHVAQARYTLHDDYFGLLIERCRRLSPLLAQLQAGYNSYVERRKKEQEEVFYLLAVMQKASARDHNVEASRRYADHLEVQCGSFRERNERLKTKLRRLLKLRDSHHTMALELSEDSASSRSGSGSDEDGSDGGDGDGAGAEGSARQRRASRRQRRRSSNRARDNRGGGGSGGSGGKEGRSGGKKSQEAHRVRSLLSTKRQWSEQLANREGGDASAPEAIAELADMQTDLGGLRRQLSHFKSLLSQTLVDEHQRFVRRDEKTKIEEQIRTKEGELRLAVERNRAMHQKLMGKRARMRAILEELLPPEPEGPGNGDEANEHEDPRLKSMWRLGSRFGTKKELRRKKRKERREAKARAKAAAAAAAAAAVAGGTTGSQADGLSAGGLLARRLSDLNDEELTALAHADLSDSGSGSGSDDDDDDNDGDGDDDDEGDGELSGFESPGV